jgi:CHAT domain-containing protein
MGGYKTQPVGVATEFSSTNVQQGGARQVVASLWEVEDRSTATLTRGLYRSPAAHADDGAAALRQAQLTLRASGGAHDPMSSRSSGPVSSPRPVNGRDQPLRVYSAPQ